MGTALVIVESPAKARTIEKYLGEGYRVEASVGHIRDLPENASQIPAEDKGLRWARLGVNVDGGFEPYYVISPEKKQQVKLLKDAMKGVDALYLATDEDREGESIAWHLVEVLQPRVPVRRLVFNEITRTAIQRALQRPRDLDVDLVRAQEARRVVDRLYGYEVSPLLWRKIRQGLSAGRVQSVAVRLVVERERRRMAFRSAAWWDVTARVEHAQGRFDAALVAWQGRRLADGRDFGEDGQLDVGRGARVLDEAAARAVAATLDGAPARVVKVEERPYRDRPAAPFTTSTLQQEANRKLRLSARRTMATAQALYENGWITYMLTDSTTLSSEAIDAARSLIAESFGSAFLPAEPRVYTTQARNAQEAHEAIRPAGQVFRGLDEAGAQLSGDALKLYELIWKRTVACQMADAVGRTMKVVLHSGEAELQATGRTIDFPGFRRAYVEGADDPEAELADQERLLPPVAEGDSARLQEPNPKGHETKPPARLTEATLVKELEARGIGRPSTYASIIDTILRREYVFKKGTALVPTFTAFAVTTLLERHLSWLVDYGFTAQMEDQLDEVALGKEGYDAVLSRFYRGALGLAERLASAADQIDPREVCTIPLGDAPDVGPIDVRVGRFGPFLAAGEERADLPKEMAPDELSIAVALKLLKERAGGPRSLGEDPDTGKPVWMMMGPYGPYVQLGDVEETAGPKGKPVRSKPPRSSLLQGMVPEEVGLEVALKLLSLPRQLGAHPTSGEPVEAANGRFGPYIRCGEQSRSLPRDIHVLDVQLDQALELLAQPPRRPGRDAIQALGVDATTGRAVRVMGGRFGPYVTDGTTNATLPRTADPERLTLAEAVELIRKREEAAPVEIGEKPKAKGRGKTAAAGGSAAETPVAAKRAPRSAKSQGPAAEPVAPAPAAGAAPKAPGKAKAPGEAKAPGKAKAPGEAKAPGKPKAVGGGKRG